jgi:hypothetical protein
MNRAFRHGAARQVSLDMHRTVSRCSRYRLQGLQHDRRPNRNHFQHKPGLVSSAWPPAELNAGTDMGRLSAVPSYRKQDCNGASITAPGAQH